MIDCDTAQRLMLDESLGPELEAHLAQCDACREEMEFGLQIAAAVTALPRHPVPDGFTERVLAALAQARPATQPPRRAAPLLLRPWELVGAGLLCLLAMAVLRSILPVWSGAGRWTSATSWLARLQAAGEGVASTISGWIGELGSFRHHLGGESIDWGGGGIVWLSGGLAFSVAFYLLLSISRNATEAGRMEDAHA